MVTICWSPINNNWSKGYWAWHQSYATESHKAVLPLIENSTGIFVKIILQSCFVFHTLHLQWSNIRHICMFLSDDWSSFKMKCSNNKSPRGLCIFILFYMVFAVVYMWLTCFQLILLKLIQKCVCNFNLATSLRQPGLHVKCIWQKCVCKSTIDWLFDTKLI